MNIVWKCTIWLHSENFIAAPGTGSGCGQPSSGAGGAGGTGYQISVFTNGVSSQVGAAGGTGGDGARVKHSHWLSVLDVHIPPVV